MDEKTSNDAIRARLQDLQKLKALLDKLDTQISEAVPRVEAMLHSLRLGVPISVKIEEDESGDGGEFLSFQKVGKDWRLTLESGPYGEPESWSSRPLSDAPRDKRAEVFRDFVPKLLDVAVDSLRQKVTARARAFEDGIEFVEAVERAITAVSK